MSNQVNARTARQLIFCLVSSIFCLLLFPSAQQPTFRSDIQLVRLNVSVLDAKRVPVRGLGKEDFTVRIDGVVQPLADVIEVDSASRRFRNVVDEQAEAVVRTNDRRERRAFVIVLDDANAQNDVRMVADTKNAAHAFVDGLVAGDLAAIVYTWAGAHNHDFTTDFSRIRRAIDRFKPGIGQVTPGSHPVTAQIALNNTIRQAVASLHRIPDVRTAIVLISPGPRNARPDQALGALSEEEAVFDAPILEGTIHDATGRQAGYAAVPIYSISNWGVPVTYVNPRTRVDAVRLGINRGHDFLHALGNLSGGRAFTDTNDVAGAARRILTEKESHYLVGYQPTYPVQDGRFRRLQITVARQDVEVVPSDRIVRVPRPDAPAITPSPRAALSEILPRDEFPLRLQARAGQIVLGINAPAPAETAAIECVAFDSGGLRERASVRAETALAALGWQEVRLTLALPSGPHTLRCGVHLPASGRMASVYGDVFIRR